MFYPRLSCPTHPVSGHSLGSLLPIAALPRDRHKQGRDQRELCHITELEPTIEKKKKKAASSPLSCIQERKQRKYTKLGRGRAGINTAYVFRAVYLGQFGNETRAGGTALPPLGCWCSTFPAPGPGASPGPHTRCPGWLVPHGHRRRGATTQTRPHRGSTAQRWALPTCLDRDRLFFRHRQTSLWTVYAQLRRTYSKHGFQRERAATNHGGGAPFFCRRCEHTQSWATALLQNALFLWGLWVPTQRHATPFTPASCCRCYCRSQSSVSLCTSPFP